MFIYNFQHSQFNSNHFFQVFRLTLKDPEVDNEPLVETPDESDEKKVIKGVRIAVPGIDENECYAFGKQFILQNEVDNGNISPKAAEFVRDWPLAIEALGNLFEYDGFTYTHTVQMLNEGCAVIDNEFDQIKQIVESGKNEEKDKKFDLTEEDLKVILFGAIVFHDWGKIKIDRGILNKPSKLDSNEEAEIHKHPMNTVKLIVSSVIRSIQSGEKGGVEHTLRDVLEGDDSSEEKRLLQMAYVAASHHNYKRAGVKYPLPEEIAEILPDYNVWFESSGKEQAIILAIFDVTDALLSERPYKKGVPREVVRGILENLFMWNAEELDKYEKLVELVLNNWAKMKGSSSFIDEQRVFIEAKKDRD